MYRIVAFIALLTLATIACSLGGESNAATATPFSFSNFPTATQNVVVVTSTPTATAAASSTPFTNNNSSNNCQIQSSWPVYVVKSGDTLGTIAQATGSTVNALTNANCLSNPNLLSVGQSIRVPRLPLPPTITPPPPTQSGVLIVGKVNFSGVIAEHGENVTLPAGQTITLSYSQAAEALSSVAFVLRSPNGVVGGVIGGDNNLNDGASVSWEVPSLLEGQQVFANGFNAVGNLVVQSQISRVYTTASTEGNIFIAPTLDGGGESIRLQAGATVTITYEGARTDLARAEFSLFDPFANAFTYIGTDNDLSNGASISWVVPLDLTGQIIIASTYTFDGILQQQKSSASLFAQQ